MFESNAIKLTTNNAVVSGVAEATGYKPSVVNGIPFAADAIAALAVDCTENGPLSMNAGNVWANMHHRARVWARCCSQAPLPTVNAQSVGASNNANPAYHE